MRKDRTKFPQRMTKQAWCNKCDRQANYSRDHCTNRKRRSRARLMHNVCQRDHNCCWICGQVVAETERSLDHVWPRSLGGQASFHNIRLAHKKCNELRGDHLP
jgi:5-methylcytosine-specific restriction endonuclease McrA